MLWLFAALALSLTWFVIMPFRFCLPSSASRTLDLTVKIIPTTMAALFGLAAFLRSGGADRYALLIFVGLCVCVAADYLLGVKFIAGGALFFTGHMFYLAALGGIQKPAWWSLAVFAVSVIALWLFCRRYLHLFPSKLMVLAVMVYCCALGALLSFSLPLPFTVFSRRTVLAALGALLFVLSDMGTCHVILAKPSRQFDYASLGIYYTAQFLLGMSAFL